MSIWTDFIIDTGGKLACEFDIPFFVQACKNDGVYVFDLEEISQLHYMWTCGSKQSAQRVIDCMKKMPWKIPEWVVIMWRSDAEDCSTWHTQRLIGHEHLISREFLG